jgi:hypothetical protein
MTSTFKAGVSIPIRKTIETKIFRPKISAFSAEKILIKWRVNGAVIMTQTLVPSNVVIVRTNGIMTRQMKCSERFNMDELLRMVMITKIQIMP